MTKAQIAKLFKDYAIAKREEAKAKALSNEIKALLKAKVAIGESLDGGGYTAKITIAAGTTKFDAKRFAAEHPDLYEQYLITTEPTERLYFR